VSVKVYIEGGGEGQLLDTLFRQGWRQFFEAAGFAGRMPSVVRGQGRAQTFDLFATAVGFDRERAIFPRRCWPSSARPSPRWAKLEALHGAKTGEQVLGDLCKWMDRTARWPRCATASSATAGRCAWLLQGGPRAEPGAGGALRGQPAGAHPAAALQPALGEVAGCDAEPQRHPGGDAGAQEPAHRPDRRGRIHQYRTTATRASRSSSSSGARWCTSRWTPSRVHMTTRLAGAATTSCPSTRAGRRRRQPARPGRAQLPHGLPVGRGAAARQPARPARALLHLQVEEKRDDEGRKVKQGDDDLPALPPAAGGARLVAAARARAWGTTTWSSTRPAAARATPSAGWRTGWPPARRGQRAVFDSVIVVTDRVVLDQQLQDTIYQFEHKQGVVQKIDETRGSSPRRWRTRCRSSSRRCRSSPSSRGSCSRWPRSAASRARHAADPALRRDHRRGAQLAGRRDGDGPQGGAGRRGTACARRPASGGRRGRARTRWRSCSAAWPSAAGRRT
jgi:hypothetical protein